MRIINFFLGFGAKVKLYMGLALGGIVFLAAFAKSNQSKGKVKERLDAMKKDYDNATEIDKRVDTARHSGVRNNADKGYRD
jgi:hypothetical protein